MAKSGFVPAWMKIQSSDKINGNQKLTVDRTNSNTRPSQTANRGELNGSSPSPPIITGRQRHHSSDIFDQTTTRQCLCPFGQSDGSFSLSSPQTPTRRSYSRERSTNPLMKISDLNGSEYPSHSVSSYSSRHESTNGTSAMTIIKTEQSTDPRTFDRLEQDFPSLNSREKKNSSSSNEHSSSIWNNAASKLRTSHHEPFKLLDRSLSNQSRTSPSNRTLARKERLLSTPNGINGSTAPSRVTAVELQTNYRTQTKNLDKRSDFFNSLKNEDHQNGRKHPETISKSSKGTLLILSVRETSEEKEFLIRMGWKDGDEISYEITDQDKEEYEKRLQYLPKVNGRPSLPLQTDQQRSAALMSALYRRTLPCVDIRDFLQFPRNGSVSDDDSSED